MTDEKKATEFIAVFIHFQARGVYQSSLDFFCQFGQLPDQTRYLFLVKTGQVKNDFKTRNESMINSR
ncbi:hypothetical protein [Acinetobacter schindleri]|uniref:hypothetical protein n=1 Tax=Acinetobacter schindleri TaxID=108981 RepID=UPI0021CD9675|nr:hypothetical protein [Acinetobacter schindleri]MCU4322028.1 hypothetical protein [Acinetobacter schindleri]